MDFCRLTAGRAERRELLPAIRSAHNPTMTLVTTHRRPKRPAKPAVEIKVPRIVQHTPKGKAWRLKPIGPDPEADARVADLMARMVRPRTV
jgi:hypothetical protein